MINRSKELEVVAEVEPEICFNAEAHAEPPQPSAREELLATLHPLTPDMLVMNFSLAGPM